MLKIVSVFFLLMIFFTKNSSALTLSEFLDQVKNQNLGYLAANQNAEAYDLLKKKAELVTAVNLFAYTQTGFTEQNQALQIFSYSRTYTQNNQVGFTKTSDFGLNTKFYYSLNHTTYKGLNTSSYSNPSLVSSNYQTIPTIELSLPLWQNRLGASTKSTKDATYFANESQKLIAKAVSVSSLVEAEKSYWALVAARKILAIQKNAAERTEQILSYVSKKEAMNLGEKGDVLQAKALVETKNLLVKQAQNDEKIAARNFNKQRYLDSSEVAERLDEIDLARLQNFLVPKVKAGNRFDVKAGEASMKAAVAAAKVEEENNKPSLNLYGSYAVNQLERNNQQALYSSFDEKGRSGLVGLRLSMPLNFGLESDIRLGALKSASAAKMNYRQKAFEEENDWQNLVQNLDSYKENLKLSLAIESAQKLKLENERNLLRQGRTSTYQILLFEQDYSSSVLATTQISYRLLELIAEKKLYESNQN